MELHDTTNYHLYKTDLTDEQWELIEPLLPINRGAGDNVKLDLRMVVNATPIGEINLTNPLSVG